MFNSKYQQEKLTESKTLTGHYVSLEGNPNKSKDYPVLQDYLRVLSKWVGFAERDWHQHPQDASVGFYGTGLPHGGIDSAANAMLVYSLLAGESAYDSKICGLSQNVLLERALGCLRFLTRAHLTGDLDCMGSTKVKWGHDGETSQYLLVMICAAELIWDKIPGEDKKAVKRVVLDEVKAHIFPDVYYKETDHGFFQKQRGPMIATSRFGPHRTYPESNAWRGAMFARALLLYPDHPDADIWKEKMNLFVVNSLSVPQDCQDNTLVGNKTIKEWYVGANLHPHFALEHHGFFQPDYYGQTFGSLAMACLGFRMHNQPIPLVFLHHARDAWNVMKKLYLWNGRFAYPSGQDWWRYDAWASTETIPFLVMLQNEYDDSLARSVERGLFYNFDWEQEYNANGSFHSKRLMALYRTEKQHAFWTPDYNVNVASEAYFLPETYAASRLALAYLFHKEYPIIETASKEKIENEIKGVFYEKDAKLVFYRGKEQFTSWSWRAFSETVNGLIIPKDGDSMGEWVGNMTGLFHVRDCGIKRAVAQNKEIIFDNGFATIGEVQECEPIGGYDYPEKDLYAITHNITFVTLPDGHTNLIINYAMANRNIVVIEEEGLKFSIANDIFNNNFRTIYHEYGSLIVKGVGETTKRIDLASRWLNVDNKLGILRVYGPSVFTLRTFTERNAPFHSMLYDLIDCPFIQADRMFRKEEVIQDTCFLFLASIDCKKFQSISTKNFFSYSQNLTSPIRIIVVRGQDNHWYAVASNYAHRTERATIKLSFLPRNCQLISLEKRGVTIKDQELSFDLPGKDIAVFVMDE